MAALQLAFNQMLRMARGQSMSFASQQFNRNYTVSKGYTFPVCYTSRCLLIRTCCGWQEKQAVNDSEMRLHREIDTQAESILTAEQQMIKERDAALLKRAKRNALLRTLQDLTAYLTK